MSEIYIKTEMKEMPETNKQCVFNESVLYFDNSKDYYCEEEHMECKFTNGERPNWCPLLQVKKEIK